MRVKIYVEGGGDGKALRTKCRMGFSIFFENAGLSGRMPRIIACGGRENAFDRFRTAFEQKGTDEFIVLLVDSEDAVADSSQPWEHLAQRDHWVRPSNAAEEQAHLMVRCMEAWFLADVDVLIGYFGSDFKRGALPGNSKIEEIGKDDVLRGLQNASRRCRKGEYRKGHHSFDILQQITPSKVVDVSPHAKRLIDTLREKAT